MRRKIYLVLLVLLSIAGTSKSQTVAMDFTQNDCAGTPHHLYSELDSGFVIVKEFIMTCSSCIVAGHALEAMMSDIHMQYPGRVRLYQFAYTNSYSCATMENFKSTNGFSSCTFDQGANMVAYYGGFGMPTVAIVAGPNHDVLYTNQGFATSDTAYAGPAIRNFLASTVGVNETPGELQSLTSFPNPASDRLTVELNLKSNATVNLQIVDLSGKLISDVFTSEVSAGPFVQEVNVASIASGYYMLKATINNKSSFNKIRISR